MPLAVPRDPLARFLAIAAAIDAEARWWENRTAVRYSAMSLVLADGEPAAIATRVIASSRQIADEAGWFSDLRGAMRFVVAGLAIGDGRDPAAFAQQIAAIREHFRSAGVRRGGAFEVVAAAMLHLTGRTGLADAQRLQQVYTDMRKHHWWLTGVEDLPAAALLSVRNDDLGALSMRIETIYAALRGRGLSAGNSLQIASHVLCLAKGNEVALVDRFCALHDGFRKAGIQMWDCDRDELALLCLLDEAPATTIARVIEQRAAIRERLRRLGPVTSFSFACVTALLTAHAGRTLDAALARDLQVANLVLAINAGEQLRQQQTAATTAATC